MTQAILAIAQKVPPAPGLGKLVGCRRGDLTEALFVAGCIVQGWEAFKAFGHDHTADWIIVRGILRLAVQVKTATLNHRGDYLVNVKRGNGTTRRPYEAGDFDVLAAYLPDRHEFVFWSFTDIRGRLGLRYSVDRHRRPGNWQLLSEIAKSCTPGTADVPPPL